MKKTNEREDNTMPSYISKTAQATLEALLGNMQPGESRKIDNTGATFMPVHVEYLSADRVSVAHYYEQNGDMMADPDMEFWRFYPINFTMHGMGVYRECIEFGRDGKPADVDRNGSRELCSFTATWMANIRDQQGSDKVLRGPVTPAPESPPPEQRFTLG